jgi:hypothetical protein
VPIKKKPSKKSAPKAKPKGKPTKAKAKRKKTVRKDTYLNQPGLIKSPKQEAFSNIFPKEMSSRMASLVHKNGISGLEKSFNHMTVANGNSRFALPAMGDYTVSNPTPAQKARITASIGDKKMGVEASLTIHAANVMTLQPFFHTPGNAQDSYNLPKSYVEQIRWSRLMFNLNPYIASVTELKAYYPISKFKLSTSEPWVTDFYEENAFNKKFNLYKFTQRMSLSIKKFGEAIVWGTRRQDGVWPQTGQPRWMWSNFILLEPELVEIKKEVMGDPNPRYFLRPNRDFEELVRRLDQNDPSVSHLQGTIAPSIINKIKSRELIPLDPTTISAIQNLTDGSAERGTPPYQRLFVNFTFEDFVRLALMAQAQRYHFPVELWTVGNLEKNIIPSVKDLEAFRDMVASAIQAPPFSMFFPPIVDYKALGVSGSLIDIKALALDTPIPTPTGWTTMGALKVGDKVLAGDGSVTAVKTLSPIYKDRPAYSVKVNGADAIVADADHRWVAGRYYSKRDTSKKSKVSNFYEEKIFKTSELIGGLHGPDGKLRYKIPVAGPLELPSVDLPIPPYMLGAWLGDGDTPCNGVYTCHDDDKEIIDYLRADGFEVSRMKGYCHWYIKGFKKTMKAAGFVGNKHIPMSYLRASFKQRLYLLQGLMDTDGTACTGRSSGCCRFNNTNYALVQAVRELLLTLGFKPGLVCKEADKFRKDIGGKDSFSVAFSVGLDQPIPFRLKRKANQCASGVGLKRRGVQTTRRSIESIDQVESVPTRCIQVTHTSGTYLAGRGFVVTHNSDMEYAHKQYLIGLGVNENMILGDALALDTLIPTPTGWTTMGNLKVGDDVFSRDGAVTKVVALSPIWKDRPTYSVKVDGAEAIVADERHKWVVGVYSTKESSKSKCGRKCVYSEKTLRTLDMKDSVQGSNPGQPRRYRIPMNGALDLPSIPLPVPPYTLGAWLGDGDTRGHGQFTQHPDDVETVDNIRADGFQVSRHAPQHSARYGPLEYSWGIKGLKKLLDHAGLSGNKHIPRIYLRASLSQRLALLQGLMDTDGTVRKDGLCSFDNTNYGLVKSIRELLLTLGLKPHPISKKSDNRKSSYKDCFRVSFTVGIGQVVPFRLQRKIDRCFTGLKRIAPTRRPIESIDLVASVPTICIQVAHPSGTFLAGCDFVVTHNSGIFSSNETAGNQTFIRLVQKDRDDIEEWMRWNFFEPLAQWNNLKIEKNGRLMPIIPNIEWEKTLDFKAAEDEREMLKWAFGEGLMDPETLIEALLNRNPEEIKVRIRKAIGGVFDNGKLGGEGRKKAVGGEPEPEAGGGGGGGGIPKPPAPGGGGGPELAPTVGKGAEAPGLAPSVGGPAEAKAPEVAPAGGPKI